MPNTVANQKKIYVHRDSMKGQQFLQIRKDHWYAVNKEFSPFGLQLYLYLVGNKDGYEFALSQEAAEMEAGIKKTTFHKYINLFIKKGYLVPKAEGSNIYDMYETPYGNEIAVSPNEPQNSLDEQPSSPNEQHSLLSNKEIYNIDNNTNKIDSRTFTF